MEATVTVDGRDVRFVSSAATPLRYRELFGKDLLRELKAVSDEMKDGKADAPGLPIHALEVFINMAYVMARDGDPAMTADTPAAWLEGFSPMFMYEVIPVVQALWSGNMARLEEAKKKVGRLTGTLQRHCSCSEPCSSGCRCGTSNC